MNRILTVCAAAALTIYICGVTYAPTETADVVTKIAEEPIMLSVAVTMSEKAEYNAAELELLSAEEEELTEEEPNQEEIMLSQAEAELDKIESIGDLEEWFVRYKEVIEEYEEWIDAPESIYDVYSEDEIYIMCRVIETETHGLSFEKKCNVASVILNRIENDNFPDTPYEVCTAANQFVYSRTSIADSTLLALEYAYMIEDTTGGALYFHSRDIISESWNGHDLIMTDGSHAFYG